MISQKLYINRYSIFFGLILLCFFFNLFIDVMEIDAAQYAGISREMAETGNYLQVKFQGKDYLDKPPLLFWLSSLSISLFGNTSFAYKLLPVFLLALSLFATFRFASLWYSRRTGMLAALLLGSTQAFALMSNDVRTDGLLTTFVILSTWFLSEYIYRGKKVFILLAGFCLGAGMLAKGPLGFFIPVVAVGGHLLLTRQWKKIFDPSWLLLIPVMAVVLAPMCYGLYMQYDMHPEKEVYGMKGPSGLRFFFWTQSFGRITGESQWDNNAPWYYFLQTIPWDLQPWLLFFLPALWSSIKGVFTIGKNKTSRTEWISFCGFIIPLIALSFSGYKLPHYVFPLFPFAAVLIAAWMMHCADQLLRWFEYVQLGVIHLLAIASLLIMIWVFPVRQFWLPLIWGIMYTGIWWWRYHAKDAVDRWILPSLSGVLAFQFILSLHFYPQLLKYQAGSQVGKFIKQENPEHVFWYDEYDFAMDYYADRIIPQAYGPAVDSLSSGTWIYVTEKELPNIPAHKIIRTFDHFPPSRLSMKFLNPATRNEKVQKMFLVELINDNY